MEAYYRNMNQRTELVIGPEGLDAMSRARVIVFGLGGVGSWCAEALVRSGVSRMTIVDSDVVCVTNVNRQSQATSRSIGKPKAGELRLRLLEINPGAEILALDKAFTPQTKDEFDIASYDYVVDAIDSVSNKVLLIEICLRLGKKIVSSMGAGARSDSSRIKVDKLSKTINCSLARVVRKRLREKMVRTDFLCVYSTELPVEPAAESLCGSGACPCEADRAAAAAANPSAGIDWCARKKRINGALVHITGIFGFTLAGLIVRDIAGIQPIPVRLQKK
jgi:tRNA threonylcarbamoyladenosine dehydratase